LQKRLKNNFPAEVLEDQRAPRVCALGVQLLHVPQRGKHLPWVGMWGPGCRDEGLGFGVQGLGFEFGVWGWGLGFRI
jgi:hypothetical protein